METHVFKLNSGVECEIKFLVGKHQRWLTEQDGVDFSTKLNKVLADVIIRVGSKKDIDVDFVTNMLSVDRKKALVELRQFSLDFEIEFDFNYEYISEIENEKKVEPLTLDISSGFNEVPLKVLIDSEVVEAPYKEYSDINTKQTITLPKSGKKVTFSLLNGVGEKIAMKTPKKERSSHTAIMMRRPTEEHIGGKGDSVQIQLNLDDLGLKDIEFLRASIKEAEGSIDTEYMFEHPEAELKPQEEKEVVIDLINTMAFFFPSQAI